MEITVDYNIDFPSEKLSVYEYGDITFSGNRGVASSKQVKKAQMMIFLSLSYFHEDITALLQQRKQFDYVFTGISTLRFRVGFKLLKREITIYTQDQIIDVIPSDQFYRDLCNSLIRIRDESLNKMEEEDRLLCRQLFANVESPS